MPTERLKLEPPPEGHKILIAQGALRVPDDPIVPLIEGDGVGPDVTAAARRTIDAAVDATYAGRRRIAWYRVPAGESALIRHGDMLPDATTHAIREYVVALKGPLTTPVGGGFRSLNVALRQTLDLFANVRPVYWLPGVPSPVLHPERLDIVIFREATEDVYAGIEWAKGSDEARRILEILRTEFNVRVREDSGIGLKPISEFCSKRLVRKAIAYALAHGRRSVTLVHKGNIMKFTEGAFREWGYEVARDEFGDRTATGEDVQRRPDGRAPEGKVVIKDVIADNMFQQLLLRPAEYDVIATSNLNGDYLSDAAAAQVGGLGVAPGGNLGDAHALFEPIHGSAPKYAGMDKVNPTAEILAGAMMLEHIGWDEAAIRLKEGVRAAIRAKAVTYDLARQMAGATEIGTSAFAEAIVRAIRGA
ncbi:MAG: isocitrate dehydrogenase (NADP(+)) [Euryarchaeota archaeon RBG_16_67_27]|nr:MAG: isocitrate dehydrogenase (NADP(+)) [Euryarchaeota archaeon RBG_16_67_27]